MKSGVNFRVGGFVLQQIPVGAAFPQIRVSLLRHLAAAQGDGHACFFDLLHQAAQDFRRKPWILSGLHHQGAVAGTGGGRVVFEGTPRNLEQCPASYTGKYLRLRTKL